MWVRCFMEFIFIYFTIKTIYFQFHFIANIKNSYKSLLQIIFNYLSIKKLIFFVQSQFGVFLKRRLMTYIFLLG
jgi:hypothetical protein